MFMMTFSFIRIDDSVTVVVPHAARGPPDNDGPFEAPVLRNARDDGSRSAAGAGLRTKQVTPGDNRP